MHTSVTGRIKLQFTLFMGYVTARISHAERSLAKFGQTLEDILMPREDCNVDW